MSLLHQYILWICIFMKISKQRAVLESSSSWELASCKLDRDELQFWNLQSSQLELDLRTALQWTQLSFKWTQERILWLNNYNLVCRSCDLLSIDTRAPRILNGHQQSRAGVKIRYSKLSRTFIYIYDYDMTICTVIDTYICLWHDGSRFSTTSFAPGSQSYDFLIYSYNASAVVG
jgi:hypothetical protein